MFPHETVNHCTNITPHNSRLNEMHTRLHTKMFRATDIKRSTGGYMYISLGRVLISDSQTVIQGFVEQNTILISPKKVH